MEETYHVTFSEDDEAISQSSTEGDAINFNVNRSFLDDEFLVPMNKVTQCFGNIKYFPFIPEYETILENISPIDSPITHDSFSLEEPPEFTTEGILHPSVPQGRWLKEKHIEVANIIGEPLAGITTRSMIRDSEAASDHECMYVNFLSKMEPKKLIEALEEKGWIIAIQEELNQFDRNKVWILVPKPHDVKLVRDLHTTNVDQLHAYLGQHEFHANEKGDDLIDAINHMMSFLTAVVTSRVTLQSIQERHTSLAVGTSRTYTSRASGNNSRKQRTVIYYNCKGEGHMSKQCTKPKWKRDESWFRDKVLLVQAQANG
nr:hypothetical protein [Tanacetum cinerariifolium]